MMHIRLRNIDPVWPHNGSYEVRFYFRAVAVAVERVDLMVGLNNYVWHSPERGYTVTAKASYVTCADLMELLDNDYSFA